MLFYFLNLHFIFLSDTFKSTRDSSLEQKVLYCVHKQEQQEQEQRRPH